MAWLSRSTFLRGCAAFQLASRPLTTTRAHASTTSGAQISPARSKECKPPCARVIPVPILQDNYAYLLVDEMTGETACVDPAEPSKILAAAEREKLNLTTLLCTHHHWDHAGGNLEMVDRVPGLKVITTNYEDIPGATQKLADGQKVKMGNLEIQALLTPCHTNGHILFYITRHPSNDKPDLSVAPILFSGDTLFVGGCGRFFEGNGADMTRALIGKVAKLPPETYVFCGHEYTRSNFAFAKTVEPKNKELMEKAAWVDRTLADGGYTVPSTIGEELATNPFMRVNVPEVMRRVMGHSDAADWEVMGRLRWMKDNF